MKLNELLVMFSSIGGKDEVRFMVGDKIVEPFAVDLTTTYELGQEELTMVPETPHTLTIHMD